jgi:pimeloyl-ACP methyl ester carboxylesterase
MFASRYIDAGGLRQHVVTGGDGPPLLLVHGWPQTWYAWRLVMPALARSFRVVVPDQRGCGLSGRPEDGYDTATLAGDLAALMDAVAGHDTGMWIGYALAADHPGRVSRLAVAETPLPGVSPSPPLFASAHLNNALWHFAFNRLAAVNDQLVTGREEVYFGWQFATKAARPLPGYAVRHYIATLAADPGALHASFAIYRALDATITQNQERMTRRLTLPVLGIGGAHSLGDQVADTMKLTADNVQTLVIPGCGHHPPEETPEELVTALTAFLASSRTSG